VDQIKVVAQDTTVKQELPEMPEQVGKYYKYK
jgi:hypothetical protein